MNEGVHTSNIIKVNNEQTTSFELTYSSDLSTRTLRLQQQSSPITVADLPKSLHSKAFHIAPIAGEISYDVVKRLKNYGACISIDPQGMTRRFDTNGNVTCSVQIDKHVLNLIDIYRSSLEEAVTLTGQSDLNSIIKTLHELGPKIVIITIGEKGSVLSTSGSIFKVPIYTSANVVDPTGAGDAFIGALLTEYVAGKNLLWCACVGSAAASIVVENIGSTSFGEKTEIYRRASSISIRLDLVSFFNLIPRLCRKPDEDFFIFIFLSKDRKSLLEYAYIGNQCGCKWNTSYPNKPISL